MPSFPVLAFAKDTGRYAIPGREDVDYFVNEEDFSTCVDWKLRERFGMTLVDSAGRCWAVQNVIVRGAVGGWPMRVLRFLLRQRVHRLDQQLAEAGAMSLGEIQERTVRAILANPDHWRDDEFIAGEAGPPVDEEVFWAMKEAVIRKARSVPEIIDALDAELDPPPEVTEPPSGV